MQVDVTVVKALAKKLLETMDLFAQLTPTDWDDRLVSLAGRNEDVLALLIDYAVRKLNDEAQGIPEGAWPLLAEDDPAVLALKQEGLSGEDVIKFLPVFVDLIKLFLARRRKQA